MTATAGGDRDTATVSFTTTQTVAVVRLPEVTRVTASAPTRSTFAATAAVNFGSDEDGRPYPGRAIRVSWQYRQSGATNWINAGQSVATFGNASATFSGLLPLTTYQVRARVSSVNNRAHNGGWVTSTARTGKVTRAAINLWRAALTDAQAARSAVVSLSAALIELENNLQDITEHGRAAEQTLRIDTAVSELRAAERLSNQTQTLINTAQTARTNLDTALRDYAASTLAAAQALGPVPVGARSASVLVGSSPVIILVGEGINIGLIASAGAASALGGVLTLLGAIGIAVFGVGAVLALEELNSRGTTVKNDASTARLDARRARDELFESPVGFNPINTQIGRIEGIIAALEAEIARN